MRNLRTYYVSTFFLVLTGGLVGCQKEVPTHASSTSTNTFSHPVSVEPSGSESVDALVRQLVSQRPAKYRSGSWTPPMETLEMHRYITPEVEEALKILQSMDPSVFPELVNHLGDDRYSYSHVVAAWLNARVGDAVVIALCDGEYMHSGYKWRESPTGGKPYLSFDAYLKARDPEPWSQWAKTKTRLAIQMDFIDWCVAEEKKRGFMDAEQEKRLLMIYEDARGNMREKYSRTNH